MSAKTPNDRWRSVSLSEELMRRIAGGDRDAFAELYDRAHAWVRGLALRILRDPADAEEAALEAFVYVWRSAADYDPEIGTPAAWLTVVTKSRALDKLRSRRSRLSHEEALPEHVEVPCPADSPERQAQTIEEAERVRAALAHLPREQREPLELAYYHGYSQSELAERLGEPLGTIKTRMRTGLRRLREHLAPA